MFIPKEITVCAARANIRVKGLPKAKGYLIHGGSAKMGIFAKTLDEVKSLLAFGDRMYTHAMAAGYMLINVKRAR